VAGANPIDFDCWTCAPRSFWRGGGFRPGTLLAAGVSSSAFHLAGRGFEAFGRPERLARGASRLAGIAASERGRSFDHRVSGRVFRDFAIARRAREPNLGRAGSGERSARRSGDSFARDLGSARHADGSAHARNEHSERVLGSRNAERSGRESGPHAGSHGFFDRVLGSNQEERQASRNRAADSGERHRTVERSGHESAGHSGSRGFFDRALGGDHVERRASAHQRADSGERHRSADSGPRHRSADRVDSADLFSGMGSHSHSEQHHSSDASSRRSRNLFSEVEHGAEHHARRSESGGGEHHHSAAIEHHSGGGRGERHENGGHDRGGRDGEHHPH
jgi:hypothetical protein